MEHTSCFQHSTSSLTHFEARHPLCRVVSNPLLKQVVFLEEGCHSFAHVSEGIAKLMDTVDFSEKYTWLLGTFKRLYFSG